MAVIVFVDNQNGKANKSSLEATGYAKSIADSLGTTVTAVSFGQLDGDGGTGNFGASKVLVASNITIHDSGQLTKAVVAAVEKEQAEVVVFSQDFTGKLIAPRVAVRLNAGLVSGATALPDMSNGFSVAKAVFSGKATAQVKINTDKKVIALLPNAMGLKATGGTASVEIFTPEVGVATVKVKAFNSSSTDGDIPLPEADIVVSAGRGLKGPENWGMVEELAKEFGAATACSRPVADIGWRPHHEHVGQTGVAIRPDLYIAIGISGAIQHLAGVNGSKVIVVINTDSEAPFFKAADYGIIGDAFEVVPKLVEAIKAFKTNH
jgi:electron transfer flavoprotein alpha subunit